MIFNTLKVRPPVGNTTSGLTAFVPFFYLVSVILFPTDIRPWQRRHDGRRP